MINREMKNKTTNEGKPEGRVTGRRPNEVSGVYFSSGIKIFDPNTQEVLVQKRGDN